MEPQIDRRAQIAPRLPVDLLVELSHEGDEDAYEADAIDLGRGGIGLRAGVLPEIGQRLRCRFEVPGADSPCEAHGEVVWAHDAGRWSGAFGVRFDEIDERTADVLDRIAPAPIEDPGTPPELRAPRSVKVKLDGVAGAIEGEIESEGEVIAIEQAMPFLELGRRAEIDGDGVRVRAVLERVRLRVQDGVPRLVLELAPEREPSVGEATIQDEALEDLVARAKPAIDREASERPIEVRARELRRVSERASAPSKSMRPAREQPRLITREEAIGEHGDEAAAIRPEPALAIKAREIGEKVSARLALAWAAARAFSLTAMAKLGPIAIRTKGTFVAGWRALATAIAARAPRIGAMIGGTPRRRTTAAPSHPALPAPLRRARSAKEIEAPPNTRSRAIAIGAIVALAVGLAAYALAARDQEASRVEIHREASWAATAATVIPPPSPSAAVVTTPETITPIVVPEAAGAPSVPPIDARPEPRAMPEPALEAGRIPAPSYPSLAERAGSAPIAERSEPAGGPDMAFGATSVERGRTTTLRMSAPVQGLEGIADGSGFTVTVRGALSLDRASPISATNPAVERAAILNRGDHCVLTIRFVDGRTPLYRVSAVGTSLNITIGR